MAVVRWGPVVIGYVRPVQFLDHLTVIKIIWYHPENNWGPLIENLVQFEEDFNSGTKKSVGWGPVGIGYVRPVQFLDHLTVIKSFILQKLFHKLTIVILWLMRAAAEKCEANADRLLLSCSQASSKYNCSEAVIFSSKSKWCLTLAPSTWNIHILIKSVEPPWGNLRLSNLSRNP